MGEIQYAYRVCPCPAYDVEGMESWLGDMSAKGLHLSRDGFFCGTAVFEKGEPLSRRYRLDAVQREKGIFSDGDGSPDGEALSLSELLGWTYLTRRGDFYIYSSDTAECELNTDPAVQAIALRTLMRRRYFWGFDTLFWILFDLYCFTRGNIFLSCLSLGSPFSLFTCVLSLMILSYSAGRFLYLHQLYRRLKEGGTADHQKDWQSKASRHYIRSASILLGVILWLIIAMCKVSDSVMEKGYEPLSEHRGDVPFATMIDLDPAGEYEEDNFLVPNQVRIYSDWIAPYNANWQEHATIRQSDGNTISGGLYVHYHEASSEWIAKGIAADYLRKGKSEKDFQMLALSDMGIDSAVAYSNKYQAPCIILRDGNIVLYAYLYQSGENRIALAEWAAVFADSIAQP